MRRRPQGPAPVAPTTLKSANSSGSVGNFLSIPAANFDVAVMRWHLVVWCYFYTVPGGFLEVYPIYSKFKNTGLPGEDSFTLFLGNAGSGPLFGVHFVQDNGGTPVSTTAFALSWKLNYGDIQPGLWYMVDCGIAADAGIAGIRINAHHADGFDAVGVGALNMQAGIWDVMAFRWEDGGLLPYTHTPGRIAVASMRRGSVFANSGITALYNGGCPLLRASVAPALLTGNYSWHDMQEVSGTRVNQQGTASRDFLETGLISQAAGPC
jgi:hypothetical protein